MFNKLFPLLSSIIKPDWKVAKDVPYGNDPEQKADWYLLNSGIRPAVVFIHGGGWMAGDKNVYEGRAKKYALAGFHTFSINYRLAKFDNPETQWDAQLQDVRSFIRWLKANASNLRVDPTKIAVCGDSAGAHLSLFLGCLRDVNAVVNMFGPSDLTTPHMKYLLSSNALFGGKDDNELFESASPIRLVNLTTVPVCTIHGTKDEVVPYSQAVELKKVLDNKYVENILVTYDGGHNLNEVPWYVQQYLDMRGLWFLIDRLL